MIFKPTVGVLKLRSLAPVIWLAVMVAFSIGGCRSSSESLSRATTSTTLTKLQVETTSTSLPIEHGCAATSPYPSPDPQRPRYRLDVDIKPEQGVLEAQQSVRFVPDQDVDRLVFRLWPNGPRQRKAGAHLEVSKVELDDDTTGVPFDMTDPTTLVVKLGRTLPSGDAIETRLTWRLSLPGASRDRLASQNGAIRLGSFYPILTWEPGVGWATDPPTVRLAESGTSPVADYTTHVRHPADVLVLATGDSVNGTWHATAVRDFAMSVGRFRLTTAVANAPNPVAIKVGIHDGIDDANKYVPRIVSALEDFSRRYGPYPYDSYTVAITPGLTGGIEYPSFVMQGPNSYGRSTPHEVAHQWFYALVGNNQGRDPWLDEGLATWAEAQSEGTLKSFISKAIPPVAQGQTTRPMSWWDLHGDAYYRGAYVQPTQVLAALGKESQINCALRRYVVANAYRIARPPDLLDALKKSAAGEDDLLLTQEALDLFDE